MRTMTDTQQLLEMERKFWTEGESFFRQSVDEECLMAFPQTAGVMSKPEVAATVHRGSRWHDVEIWPRGILEPTKDFVILTYRARAIRADGELYDALVSTGYVKRSGAWKLAFHQQTPMVRPQ